MATTIYKSGYIELVDGTEVYITPLKIKYLREFMEAFEDVRKAKTDDESIILLLECMRIAMKQFYPSLMTIYDVEDNIDLQTMYKILDIAAGISMSEKEDEDISKKAKEADSSWEDLDLAKLESEVFLLGIWKDYEELEKSMSMSELVITLDSKREADYAEKKFLAAIQGVDLDKQSEKPNAWEEMKARVFGGGAQPNDIASLRGQNAAKAGFGIGLGLSYEKRDS